MYGSSHFSQPRLYDIAGKPLMVIDLYRSLCAAAYSILATQEDVSNVAYSYSFLSEKVQIWISSLYMLSMTREPCSNISLRDGRCVRIYSQPYLI